MEKQEFEALYERYGKEVRRYAARHVRPEEVEDVVQEVFAIAWKKREDLEKYEKPIGWLIKAAKFKIKELEKKRDQNVCVMGQFEWIQGCEEKELSALEWLLFMRTYLKPAEVKVFMAVYLEGRSVSEMAKREGLSVEGMRWRIKKMREQLYRAMIKQKG